MYKNSKLLSKRSDGFTIIEVVLVLAIAGLIFMMVFIALPALQKSQRDTQRKQDLARVNTAISDYIGNAKGKIPGTSASDFNSFKTGYLSSDDYSDPKTGEYSFKAYSGEHDGPNLGEIVYATKTQCDAAQTSGTKASANNRDYTLTIALEGQKIPYCIDNQ